MATASASDLVTLKGGLTVPLTPILLLLDLESRGISVTADDGDLVARPRQLVTARDRDQLRRWKQHVLMLVSYEPPELM